MDELPGIPKSVIDRFGAEAARLRIWREDTRELKCGGLIRFCPARQLRWLAEIGFKAFGVWRRGRREYLSPVVRENEFVVENAGFPSRNSDGDAEGPQSSRPPFGAFTILHLSDLHLDLDPEFPAILLEKLKSVAGCYDAAVITGDISNLTIHEDNEALREMRALMPAFTAPVFAVPGNHDSLRDVATLEEMGMRVLLNESVTLEKNGAAIRLAGIDDPNRFRTHDLAKALSNIAPVAHADGNDGRHATVLLSHSPCIHKEAAAAGVDIVLAGHTHGGQICLPWGLSVVRRVDKSHKSVWNGYWRDGATQGWTSSGAGACGVPLRINCPGEIVLHKIVIQCKTYKIRTNET